MIEVSVLEVEQSEYERTVFDQTVTVRLPSGNRMGLFDPDVLVDPESVGYDLEILIGTLTSAGDVQRIPETTPRVEPSKDQSLYFDHHIYYGEMDDVDCINRYEYEVRLDVGDGTIVVRPKRSTFDSLYTDEYLKVDAIRSDVWEIGQTKS